MIYYKRFVRFIGRKRKVHFVNGKHCVLRVIIGNFTVKKRLIKRTLKLKTNN